MKGDTLLDHVHAAVIGAHIRHQSHHDHDEHELGFGPERASLHDELSGRIDRQHGEPQRLLDEV